MSSSGYSHGYVCGCEMVSIFCPLPFRVGIILPTCSFPQQHTGLKESEVLWNLSMHRILGPGRADCSTVSAFKGLSLLLCCRFEAGGCNLLDTSATNCQRSQRWQGFEQLLSEFYFLCGGETTGKVSCICVHMVFHDWTENDLCTCFGLKAG